MRGGGVLSNRIRAGTTNSYPNLNFPPPPNPTAQNERRYRIKTAGASRTVYTVRPPRLVVPCGVGGVLSNKNTCRSDQLVVSNLNFPPPPNPTAAIIRIVLLMVNHASPRQRITFSLIRALLKLSTEATVQRFIRFKVNGSFWCRIPHIIPLDLHKK
jgi:hypothetical protein